MNIQSKLLLPLITGWLLDASFVFAQVEATVWVGRLSRTHGEVEGDGPPAVSVVQGQSAKAMEIAVRHREGEVIEAGGGRAL